MANLHKPSNSDPSGYDANRNLQVMSINRRTTFYLVAGAGLDVFTDDENVAVASSGASDNAGAHRDGTLSGWEKDQVIRVVNLAAKSPGTTLLRATLDGSDWIAPLTVRVIGDATCRQVGKAKAQVTPELRRELQTLSLRDAVIRVAEDQMCSAIARTNGFGVYNMAESLDWCGGFAYWCWDQACAIRGEDNPFGSSNTVLWSPQRAIHWGMQPTTPGQVLRYSGPSPMDGKGNQEFRDIGWNGYDLKPADIVLLRKGTASGWKHVCMVHQVDGRALETIDGNQGMPSIKVVHRSLDAKVTDGSYELAFLAVMRA
ncbi:hypothetical protein ACV229_37850 [Burkholderia sp. MR1-5-21]